MNGNRSTMPWRRMAVLLAVSLIAGSAMRFLGARGNWPDGETVAAMELFVRAQRVLWQARERHLDDATRMELASTDVLKTGLVGVEWSSLTTTPGFLEAKRTTAHPLWVAVFRDWFKQLGLKPGETVAIGASGSFPGIFFAARIAAASLHLDTVAIGSLTSSNYGANLPEMDLAAMDETLRQEGILDDRWVVFTPGGKADAAQDLDLKDRVALCSRMAELGARAHIPENRAKSIEWRDSFLLHSAGDGGAAPRVFVNIGGHEANYGVGMPALALPSGLILPNDADQSLAYARRSSGDSIALRAIRRGVPVINVLNIRGLAATFGIPFDPPRIPSPSTLRVPSQLKPIHRVLAGGVSLVLIVWLVVWKVSTPGVREWLQLGRPYPQTPREPRPHSGEVS